MSLRDRFKSWREERRERREKEREVKAFMLRAVSEATEAGASPQEAKEFARAAAEEEYGEDATFLDIIKMVFESEWFNALISALIKALV